MATSTRRIARILVPLCILIHIALAEGGPPDTVRGTMVVPAEEPVATAIALLLMAHPESTGAGPTGSLMELRPGVFVGPESPVDDEGRFELTLPPGDTLPAALLGPADSAVLNVGDMAACTLAVSDPDALATVTRFAFGTVPGVAVTTAIGIVVGVATDRPLDLDGEIVVASFAFQVWVYADRDVQLLTRAEGCADEATTLVVDVSLRTGWNRLAWRSSGDSVTGGAQRLTLGLSDTAEVHVVGLFEF